MNILQDYYESKLALDILVKEVEEKKQAVIDFLKDIPENKTEIVGAKFYLKKEYVYEFSEKTNLVKNNFTVAIEGLKEKVKKLQSGIKNIEAVEIGNGTAKILDKETKYIPVMTIKKERR